MPATSASGALDITANGDVTGTNSVGIYARNFGTDLSVTTGTGTTVTGGNFGILSRNFGTGALDITANGNVTGTNQSGIYARNSAAGTDLKVTTGAGTMVTGGSRGIDARNFGNGSLEITAHGNVGSSVGSVITGDREVFAQNSIAGTDLKVTTDGGTSVYGRFFGIDFVNSAAAIRRSQPVGAWPAVLRHSARNAGSGALTITVNGNVTGTNVEGIRAIHEGTDLTMTTAAGTTVSGARGIFLASIGSGLHTITLNGNVTGTVSDGVYLESVGGAPINLTVGATSTVTSNGVGAFDFGIETTGAAANVTVAGTINGGAGGAIAFSQCGCGTNDRLELHPTAVINGLVLAGGGTDTFVLGGAGTASFDVGRLDPTGLNQYQGFELFQKEDASHWTLTGTNLLGISSWDVNGGLVVRQRHDAEHDVLRERRHARRHRQHRQPVRQRRRDDRARQFHRHAQRRQRDLRPGVVLCRRDRRGRQRRQDRRDRDGDTERRHGARAGANGFNLNTTYTILTAGVAVTGQFDGATDNLVFTRSGPQLRPE